jgi:hypothetical protein
MNECKSVSQEFNANDLQINFKKEQLSRSCSIFCNYTKLFKEYSFKIIYNLTIINNY